MKEKKIGKVTHYYGHLGVAIVELGDKVKLGDKLHFVGHSTDFMQKVDSLEVDQKKAEEAKKGDMVGIEIDEKAREHDVVYKVEKE